MPMEKGRSDCGKGRHFSSGPIFCPREKNWLTSKLLTLYYRHYDGFHVQLYSRTAKAELTKEQGRSEAKLAVDNGSWEGII